MKIDRPQAFEYVFLDFDGTLVDSIDTLKDAYFKFLRRFGVDGSVEEFESLNGPPLFNVVELLKREHKLDQSTNELLKHYSDIIDELYDVVPISSGARDLIQIAGENSIKLGIVTSNSRERVSRWLDLHGLAGTFRLLVADGDTENGKPHPAPYLEALKRAGIDRRSAIAIEDSWSGVTSARHAMLDTFFITRSNELIESSDCTRVFVIESLADSCLVDAISS